MLIYAGKVTIQKQYVDGTLSPKKVIHNHGTYALFDFFANALLGQYDANMIPYGISAKEDFPITPFTTRRMVEYDKDKPDVGPYVKLEFSTTILGSDIANYLDKSAAPCLYTQSNGGQSTKLAELSSGEVPLKDRTGPDEDLKTLAALLISWEMEMQNGKAEKQEESKESTTSMISLFSINQPVNITKTTARKSSVAASIRRRMK